MPSFLDAQLRRPQALSYYANQLKRLCARHEGTTIELAQVQVGEEVSSLQASTPQQRGTKPDAPC